MKIFLDILDFWESFSIKIKLQGVGQPIAVLLKYYFFCKELRKSRKKRIRFSRNQIIIRRCIGIVEYRVVAQLSSSLLSYKKTGGFVLSISLFLKGFPS